MTTADILVVEDERIVALDLKSSLETMGHRVLEVVDSGEAAVESATAVPPDLVIMDVRLSGAMDGIEAAARIRELAGEEVAILFLSAFDDVDTVQRAKSSEPFGYLLKPFEVKELRIAIEMALYKAEAEARLRESELRFRTVADFTYDCETWISPEGTCLYISPACEGLTGYDLEEIAGDPDLLLNMVHPEDREAVSHHFRNLRDAPDKVRFDMRITTRGGEERWISHCCREVHDDRGNWLGRRASNRDITHRVKTQEELLKSKKRDSVAVLTAGIAHDYNNLLYVITGYVEMLKEMGLEGKKSLDFLNEIEAAALRAKALTRQLAAFSRTDAPAKQVAAIQDLVTAAAGAAFGDGEVALEIDMPDALPRIEADRRQLRQALVNILINAAEATEGKGRIRIGAEPVRLRSDNLLLLPPGNYVRLWIQDWGCGIAAADLDKIFDPYFSTKERGTQKGMGLGLSIADAIIRQHDGRIAAASDKAGTVFSLYFPVTGRALRGGSSGVRRAGTGRGKVLVMDDDEMVRNMVYHCLTSLGYEAVLAQEGEAAVALYGAALEAGDPFAAVILDLMVPGGVGGIDTLRALRAMDPEVRAILSTGGRTDSPVLSDYRDHGFSALLAKPCTLAQLDQALERVIGPAPGLAG